MPLSEFPALGILALHAVIGLAAPVTARRLGPRVFLLCALAPLATLIWAAALAEVLNGGTVTQRVSWVGALGIGIDLRLDGFSLLMVALISGVGVLIFLYSRWYFSPRPGLGRFAGTLTVFAGSMLGIVLADNLLAVYVFWELTSITSYLLIGFEDEKAAARSAALQAILITGAGGLAMLGGFVLLGEAAGTYSLSAILADPPTGGSVAAGLVLVLLGAFTKSAQVPFHSWLPAAMAAPTPVSAYLHSATMVKAGVYLIARFGPAFAGLFWFWRPAIAVVGLATMLIGGLRALRQHDLKLLLAYGTVSQLGFMVVLIGMGHPELTYAGAAMILAHGLFKATLFLLVGIIDHQTHTRDLRKLSGLGRRHPAMFAIAAIAAASMAGLPPLFGFVAKEAVLEASLHEAGALITATIVAGSILTFAYGARFVWGAFADRETVHGPPESARPALGFLLPALVLTILTVIVGLAPQTVSPLVEAAAAALGAGQQGGLSLWHGFTPALGLSAVTVAAGAALFVLRDKVERRQERMRFRYSAEDAYGGLLRGLNHAAGRITGLVQNGSLPVYVAVILVTAVALPSSALLTRGGEFADIRLAESPLQAAVAGAVLVTALYLARATQRMVAVLLLGAMGFGVAMLFVIQGAPDLALTQLLVETLAVVIFVLVLKHLSPSFKPVKWRLGKALRVIVAAGVGTFVAAFTLLAANSGSTRHVSREYVERALPEGGGANVVNVVVTDFRGLDTLGEITVVIVAAFGIASLVLVGRQRKGQGGSDEI